MINYSQYNETEKSLSKWLNIIQKERIPLYHQISHHIKPKSKIIEIGAGSAWLSACVSKNDNVDSILIIENDLRRIDLAQKYFVPNLNAIKTKLTFYNTDFHKLNFVQNNSIDIIFVDAALHYTNTLELLLQELHRKLKKSGQIIAIREPILPSLPILKNFRKKTFGLKQIKNGDIENIYTKNEWTNYFNNCNFTVTFYPLYGGSLKDRLLNIAMNKYNGILFNRYYMIATKY